MNKRWFAAVHEAAHAVASEEMKFPVRCLALREGAEVCVYEEMTGTDATDEAEQLYLFGVAVRSWAGPAAVEREQRTGGRRDLGRLTDLGSGTDYAKAATLAQQLHERGMYRTPEDGVKHIRQAASGIVTRRQHEIKRLAGALLRAPEGVLFGDEMRAIIRDEPNVDLVKWNLMTASLEGLATDTRLRRAAVEEARRAYLEGVEEGRQLREEMGWQWPGVTTG